MHEHLSFDIEEQRKVEKVISSLLFEDNSQSKEEAFDPSKIPGFKEKCYRSKLYSNNEYRLVTYTYESHRYTISTVRKLEASTLQTLHVSIIVMDHKAIQHRNILTLNLTIYPTHNSMMQIFGILQELGVIEYFKESHETIHS
jgi:hypothetical protein